MPMLIWIAIGAAFVLAMSTTLGLGLAAVLRAVGREVDELLEDDLWAVAPIVRTNGPRDRPTRVRSKTHA